MAAFAETALGHRSLTRFGGAGQDGNIRAAGFAEHAIHDFGATFGISEGGGDAENFKLGALEGKGKREGIVDVVADVGVDDHFLGRA